MTCHAFLHKIFLYKKLAPNGMQLYLVHVQVSGTNDVCNDMPTRHGRRMSAPPISWCHTRTVPRTQSRLGDRSFGVDGPRLWNSLPAELRQQDIRLIEFRRLLKTFLFAETRRIVTSLF